MRMLTPKLTFHKAREVLEELIQALYNLNVTRGSYTL